MPVEPKHKTAMISSTSVDLPEHRQQAIDACLRQGIFPKAMEHLPVRDADAIRVSLEMVDEADIYIGIYAWRYGHVPEGHDSSITEMEFKRAEERGIPILVFTIHKDHPLTITMVEADKDARASMLCPGFSLRIYQHRVPGLAQRRPTRGPIAAVTPRRVASRVCEGDTV